MKYLKQILIVLAMAAMIPAMPVSAASTYAGHVIKGSTSAIYYVTKSNTRLLFTDLATYKSWYPDFRGVITLQDWQVNQMPLVGNVTMKPGTAPIKAKGDNTVYAVARYGVARPFTTPSAASVVYGADWSSKVVTVSPTTLASYVHGLEVAGPGQYYWKTELTSVKTIDDNFDASLNVKHVASLASVTDSAQLTLTAIVVNGFDGRFNATSSDAKLMVGSTDEQLGFPMLSGKAYSLKPGDYTVYQNNDNLQGYLISDWGGDCSAAGTLHLGAGDNKTCTITYTYSPTAAADPILTVNVKVINDYHGSALPDDFPITVGGNFVKSGEAHAYAPGWYLVNTFNHLQGYVPTGWTDGVCTGDLTSGGVSVELKRGQTYSCTYTYDDVNRDQPNPTMGTLVLNATVPSDLSLSSVGLFIEGKRVSAGQLNDVDPRGYMVFFSVPSGYKGTWSGTGCNTDPSAQNAADVTGVVNQIKSCMVTVSHQ